MIKKLLEEKGVATVKNKKYVDSSLPVPEVNEWETIEENGIKIRRFCYGGDNEQSLRHLKKV